MRQKVEITGIAKAVAMFKTQTALAQKLNRKPQTVSRWVSKGEVSPGSVKAVSDLTGISREELCPSVFG